MSRLAAVLLLIRILAGLPATASAQTITIASSRGTRQVRVVTERGFPAVAAAELGAAVVAFENAPLSATGTAVLRMGGKSFTLVLDAGYFRCDDSIYTLASGPYIARESLFIPLQFLSTYLPRLTGRYRWTAARSHLEELAEPVEVARRPSPASHRADAGTPAARAAAADAPLSNVARRRVIAIDAGHGGVDQGMSGPLGRGEKFLKEKDVTLAVARALQRELEARGFGTIMTRDRDTLIALGDRGAIAGRAGADLFVSIHVNASNPRWRTAATARGFETYYLAEARTEDAARVERMENASVQFETTARAERGDPMRSILRDLAQNEHLRESSRLAELVQESVGHVHPSESRGVKQAGFMVLATSYMPAILVETGFGTNEPEARYLTSTSGQQRLARAIAEGVERYMAEFERRVAAGGS